MAQQTRLLSNPDPELSKEIFKAAAMTALSQFDRTPPTEIYGAVEHLRRRMMRITRNDIEDELIYWRGVLVKLNGPQTAAYDSFRIFHALEAMRILLGEVARRGNECSVSALKKAQDACTAMCKE
jgi:hypothetical protein